MTPDLRPIRSVLAALRGRLRAVRMLRATAYLVTGIAAAVVVSFALDRLLDLPLGVRAVHLALGVVGLSALGAWAFGPLRTKLADADLAQALEDVVPDLRDRIASALDFERRLADPEERESREMMRVVIAQASAHAQRVDPRALVDARPARRAATAAFVAALVVTVTAAALPSDFSLWLQRGILLRDVEWPRRTHIRVLDFEVDTPRVVTHGDDVQIVAEVDGVRPTELELHYEALEYPDDGGSPTVTEEDTRRMFPLEDESGQTGRYTFEFRAISTSFRFWVTGGDDDDRAPVHVVRAMVPPRVASITARVTYPGYSGLPSAVVRVANFEVLTGSRVQLQLSANMVLASARLVPEDGPVEDVALAGDGDRLELDLTAHTDLQFHLELTALTGQSNRPEQDRFLIRALPDQPPHVRMLFPIGRMYRTPDGVLPVKAYVQDDFGLAGAQLELFSDESAMVRRTLYPRAAESADAEGDADAPALVKRADMYEPVEIADLAGEGSTAVVPGDMLRVVLSATDNSGQENAAPDVSIEILSPEDLERRLAQRQVGLRDQLTQLRTHQRRTLDGIRELRSDLGDRRRRGSRARSPGRARARERRDRSVPARHSPRIRRLRSQSTRQHPHDRPRTAHVSLGPRASDGRLRRSLPTLAL